MVVQPIRDINKIEEIKGILKKQSLRNYFLFVFGINTGLRVTDMLSLKVSDVKGKTNVTIQEKGDSGTIKTKHFKINTALEEEIRKYTQNMNLDDYLFPSRIGGNSRPITRVMAYTLLNKAAKQAGIEAIGTETLRKTFGYHYYQKYNDVSVLQKLFNHSAPYITLKYIGVRPGAHENQEFPIDDFSL